MYWKVTVHSFCFVRVGLLELGQQKTLGICSGMPCVIAVLDSDLEHNTCEPRKICEYLNFPRSFSICFAQRGADYLHLRTVSRRNSELGPHDMRVHVDVHKDQTQI